jgi:hypothetical protein
LAGINYNVGIQYVLPRNARGRGKTTTYNHLHLIDKDKWPPCATSTLGGTVLSVACPPRSHRAVVVCHHSSAARSHRNINLLHISTAVVVSSANHCPPSATCNLSNGSRLQSSTRSPSLLFDCRVLSIVRCCPLFVVRHLSSIVCCPSLCRLPNRRRCRRRCRRADYKG